MGISIWQLLIVLVIVLLLFGTKKLKSIGADLGGAVKGFKSAMKTGAETDEDEDADAQAQLEQAGGEAVADPSAQREAAETKRDSA